MNDFNIISQASASSTSDYSKRYPRVIWDTLGILLGNSGATLNQPVQELLTASFTGVDILASTGGNYNAYVSQSEILSGTGPVFISLLSNFDSSVWTYPGCDHTNIKLPNGQVWAACNAGATNIWTNQTFPSGIGVRTQSINAWAGGLYQWGNNAEISLSSTWIAQTVCSNIASSYNIAVFVTSASFDWCTIQSDNMWWDTDNTLFARKGMCPTWYHIPTITEWSSASDSILWRNLNKTMNTSNAISSWELAIFQSTLHLPMAGFRNTAGWFNQQGIGALY